MPPAGTSKSPVAGSVDLPLTGRVLDWSQCQQGRGAFCPFLHLSEWHPLQNLQLALATGLQSCIIDACYLHSPQPRKWGVPWLVDPRAKCSRQMYGRRLVDGLWSSGV